MPSDLKLIMITSASEPSHHPSSSSSLQRGSTNNDRMSRQSKDESNVSRREDEARAADFMTVLFLTKDCNHSLMLSEAKKIWIRKKGSNC